jgi:SAM-dependent methyltransferase
MQVNQKDITTLIDRDRKVWDECAENYESSIVTGHPDVVAYTEFEEDLLDKLLLHLMRDRNKDVYLYDVGCGSARLHLHYGLKSISTKGLDKEEALKVRNLRKAANRHCYNEIYDEKLKKIGGLDFSSSMIDLAREKLLQSGLKSEIGKRLFLEVGSAYDLSPMSPSPLPVLVNVCNSIGVMQGEEGSRMLFQAMKRAVDNAGGIAIVSCYRQKAIPGYALGNYESTMNVSGQPVWLEPQTYADEKFLKVPKYFKLANDSRDHISVDVYNESGKLIEENFDLKRNISQVELTKDTGRIRMHGNYSSNWYSFETIEQLIEKYWGLEKSYHFEGGDIDTLRGWPCQLAIYDPGKNLKELLKSW